MRSVYQPIVNLPSWQRCSQVWSWQESTRPHTRPHDHPREPHRLTRGLLLPQKQPISTVLGHEGHVPEREREREREITAYSTVQVTYSDQDGRGRHSDARSLMGGAYHKFHHTSEEAAMGQGQGSPAEIKHTGNNNSTSNIHTYTHTPSFCRSNSKEWGPENGDSPYGILGMTKS